jgi:hypothetical protein
MPWVGFEPMIPASKRAKTVDALDRSATVTGARCYSSRQLVMHLYFKAVKIKKTIFQRS